MFAHKTTDLSFSGSRKRQKCDPGYRASVCINTPGSYECQCRDDYVGNGFNCQVRRCDHGTFGKGEFDDCQGKCSIDYGLIDYGLIDQLGSIRF